MNCGCGIVYKQDPDPMGRGWVRVAQVPSSPLQLYIHRVPPCGPGTGKVDISLSKKGKFNPWRKAGRSTETISMIK